jgi:hypothetical protein
MYSFQTAFDDYIKNKTIHDYDTIEGNLRFVKNRHNDIIIDVIYIKECFRRRGLLKKFLCYIVDHVDVIRNEKFMIVSVLSKILYDYLLRFEYNGWKFKLIYDGFLLTKIK